MISSEEEFLTVAEVATILKLNQQTVRNWIDAGGLPALHVGRRVRIRRSDFEHFLEQGQTRPAHEPADKQTQAQAFWEGELPPAPLAPDENE
jgi:excisionase family DNA binding protein